ncbi:hypothetical protein F5888DRAFT_1721078 [Russula emetica]|nr:hypothetical protein F5888DRAFT_1721078 [Russula emetica]
MYISTLGWTPSNPVQFPSVTVPLSFCFARVARALFFLFSVSACCTTTRTTLRQPEPPSHLLSYNNLGPLGLTHSRVPTALHRLHQPPGSESDACGSIYVHHV